MTTQTHIAYHMEVLRKAQVIKRKNEALQRIQEAKEKKEESEKLEAEERKQEELAERQKLEEVIQKQIRKREMKREVSNTSSDLSWISDRKLYSALNKFAQKVREAKSEPPQPVYTENGLKKYISLQGRRNGNRSQAENTRYSRHLPRLYPHKIHPVNRYTEFDRLIYPTRHVCFQCWRGFEDSPTYYGKHNPRVHKLDT